MSSEGWRRPQRLVMAAGLIVGLRPAPSLAADAADRPKTASPACPPAAALQGPPELVEPIAAILNDHGVATGPGPCGSPGVSAVLGARPDVKGYRVHLRDSAGRSVVREVEDPATAATLVESWALGVDADVWSPRSVPKAPDAGRPGDPPPATVVEGGRDPASDRPVGATAGPQFGGAAETSITSDGAIWWGTSASVCTRIAGLCAGGRAAVARAETTLEIDRALGIAPDLTRTLGGLTALVSWPMSAGRLWVTPSLGLGVAWLHSHAEQRQVTSTTDDLLVRGEAGASTGVAIAGGWSVGLGVGASVAQAISGDLRQGTMTYIPAVPGSLFTMGVGLWYGR